MSTVVHVDGLVMFTHADLILTRDGRDAAFAEPKRLLQAIKAAVPFMQNELFAEAMSGRSGPLSALGNIELEDFIIALKAEEVRHSQLFGAQIAKSEAIQERRREFNRNRADLILKMLDADVPYLCAAMGCEVTVALTVDHKIALSRGGTDNLENLQFLCRTHNSRKSYK